MVERVARITVIAGVNGAGKSSVVGTHLRARGAEYFNPDEATQAFLDASRSMTADEANARAWNEGRQLLEDSIHTRQDLFIETTLGGASITKLLARALDEGLEVVVMFVGLDSVERHLARVRSRVQAGGHDIPEGKIRERYVSSIKNIVTLAPRLTMLRVFDNSAEADPKTGTRPAPREILQARNGALTAAAPLHQFPHWAKPIFMVLTNTAAT